MQFNYIEKTTLEDNNFELKYKRTSLIEKLLTIGRRKFTCSRFQAGTKILFLGMTHNQEFISGFLLVCISDSCPLTRCGADAILNVVT